VIRFGTPAARWVIAATVLGSGIAFLDGTVVNVALPAIARDLDTDIAGLQWTVDAYLVTLTSLLLLGGALGDHYGHRRIFTIGLGAFTVASVVCAAAPDAGFLAAARALQGAGGALLVPGSLAIIGATFAIEDRGRAIGAWSGMSGVASAIGPFLGGWLIDAASWRYVFLINVPLALVAIVVTVKHVPETKAHDPAPLDWAGAVLATVGLAAASFALIESAHGFGVKEAGAAVVGVGSLVAFLIVEARIAHPMLPLRLFRSSQFSGANATTLAVYAALGALTFFLVLELQLALGYSALEAGAALLPVTVLMLTLSARAGALAQRVGPRLPMTVGPMIVAVGMLMFTRITPGDGYWTAVFPAAVVFGLGLACTVAPLTATVLGAVNDDEMGVASAVNNAAARLAGLLAVAVLPSIVGLSTDLAPEALTDKAATAIRICAVLSALGGVIAFFTVRTSRLISTSPRQADVSQPCHDPCVAAAAGD
jgi:EmrB/QacA subfamily drug resistance transporter